MIRIEIANRQEILAIDRRQLRHAATLVLRDARLAEAHLSLAIVDDPAIHALNRQYLGHDWSTDVLSFPLERSDSRLEGEVIVSAQTAAREAGRFGWAPADELLLYVIHGTLHLVGQADDTPTSRAAMRARERQYLAPFGLEPIHRRPKPRGRKRTP